MRYIDCTLTILNKKQIKIRHKDSQGEWDNGAGKLGAASEALLTVRRMNYWINYGLKVQEALAFQALSGKKKAEEGNPCKLEDLKLVGLMLYKILFYDPDIRQRFHTHYKYFYETHQVTPDQRMRLKLVFEKPADNLSDLPWEFLFIPEDRDEGGNTEAGGDDDENIPGFFFSGEKTELILTRNVPKSKLVSELAPKEEALRILVVISSPARLGKIDQTEVDELFTKIDLMPKASLTRLDNPTFVTLRNQINDPANPPYHILHFIGHGQEGELALVKAKNDPDYDEEEGDNQVRWVKADQFRKLFSDANRKPSLVFLHACKGATETSHEGFKSVARELVYAEIPAVVAMQYSISNADAGVFARTFYEQISKGSPIDEAVKAGRQSLGELYPYWEHPRFGTPVVYLQGEMSNTLVIPLPEETPQPTTQGGAMTSGAAQRPQAGPSADSVVSRRDPKPASTLPGIVNLPSSQQGGDNGQSTPD